MIFFDVDGDRVGEKEQEEIREMLKKILPPQVDVTVTSDLDVPSEEAGAIHEPCLEYEMVWNIGGLGDVRHCVKIALFSPYFHASVDGTYGLWRPCPEPTSKTESLAKKHRTVLEQALKTFRERVREKLREREIPPGKLVGMRFSLN